jgi:ATP synthase protein I
MKNDAPGGEEYGSVFRSLGPLLGSGIQLAASVIIMFFIGRWLDDRCGTTPWLMVTGIFIGIGAGLTSFIRTVNEMEKKKGGKA